MKYLVTTLILIIILLVAGLAFSLGRNPNITLPSLAPTPTPTFSPLAGSQPTIYLTPTPTTQATKTVTGGGILSFPKYQLTIPTTWEASTEIPGPDSEKVILKKAGGYELSILEGGFGGSICLYPGDADTEGPSARYEQYVDITTKSDDLLRRSWTGTGGFAICHKTQYGWNAPTLFGHISIKTPPTYTPEAIAEIDQILASFTRI